MTLGAEVLTTADGFAARDFFLAPMTTALPAGAVVTGLRFPRIAAARRGTGFAEVAMRQGDYAMAAAACELVLGDDGAVASLRLGIGGATPVPVLLDVGAPTRDAVAAALAPLEMMHDPNAGAGYRRRAALALAMQALDEAQREVMA